MNPNTKRSLSRRLKGLEGRIDHLTTLLEQARTAGYGPNMERVQTAVDAAAKRSAEAVLPGLVENAMGPIRADVAKLVAETKAALEEVEQR